MATTWAAAQVHPGGSVFGAVILAVIIATRLVYPDDAALARNEFLVIAAVAVQVLMVVLKLETLRELRVLILFHIVGTGMELFKTSVGSGDTRRGGAPRFSPG